MATDSPIQFDKLEFVFLDRDGVLNRKPPTGGYISRQEDFDLLSGAAQAVASLNRSGRKVIVVTNQRGIALGLYSPDDLNGIHEKLRAQLAVSGAHVDAIYVCPHDAGQCSCRKPLTGLFEQAFQDFPGAAANNSIMVGDALRDIEAGARMGMTTVLVTGDERADSTDAQQAEALAQLKVGSLAQLVHNYFCRNG